MTSATFSSLVGELPDVNVVAPDLPGFGGTSDSGFEHSLDAYADFVTAIAERIPGDVHLLGYPWAARWRCTSLRGNRCGYGA